MAEHSVKAASSTAAANVSPRAASSPNTSSPPRFTKGESASVSGTSALVSIPAGATHSISVQHVAGHESLDESQPQRFQRVFTEHVKAVMDANTICKGALLAVTITNEADNMNAIADLFVRGPGTSPELRIHATAILLCEYPNIFGGDNPVFVNNKWAAMAEQPISSIIQGAEWKTLDIRAAVKTFVEETHKTAIHLLADALTIAFGCNTMTNCRVLAELLLQGANNMAIGRNSDENPEFFKTLFDTFTDEELGIIQRTIEAYGRGSQARLKAVQALVTPDIEATL